MILGFNFIFRLSLEYAGEVGRVAVAVGVVLKLIQPCLAAACTLGNDHSSAFSQPWRLENEGL